LHQKTPSPAQARPDLPPALVNTIMRCLEKDRTKRFANIDEFAASLIEVAPARARLSIERIARLTVAGGVPSRSSSHMRSGAPVGSAGAAARPRPDLLSSADGWGAPAPVESSPAARRRQFVIAGMLALILVSALYWMSRRSPVAPSAAASAPSASSFRPATTSPPASSK
jgi:hypothetical protein